MRKGMKKYLYISMGLLMLLFGACSRQDAEDAVMPDATATPEFTLSQGEATASVSPEPTTALMPTLNPEPTIAPTPALRPSPTIAPTPTMGPDPTATPTELPTEIPTDPPEPTKIPSPEEPVAVGEDGILVDNELCKVQLVSFGKEQSDVVVRLSVENRSEKDLIFSAGDIYVNRVANSFLEVEVPAGETVEERVLLLSLERLGITDISGITEILIPLEIYDARQVTYQAIWSGRGNMPWLEEWSLCDWPCVIYPQGKEAVLPFSYKGEPDAFVMAENEYFTMLLIDEVYGEGGSYTAKVFVENHTDAPLFLETEEYSLNGFRCEPYEDWEAYLHGNTKAFGAIYWYDERLEESEGYEVERLGFSLSANGDDIFSQERYLVYPKGEEAVKEYPYIPEEQDVMLYDGPECMLVLTDFGTKGRGWTEEMLVTTAYFENKSEEELSFRIEGTEQAYMRSGRTDEWNEYSADLWSMHVGAGEKQKVVLYLDEYPENSEERIWTSNLKVEIGKDRENFFEEWTEVAVPMEAFEEETSEGNEG